MTGAGLLRRPRPAGAERLVLRPEDAGWRDAGLRVVALAEGERYGLPAEAEERLVLPLSGCCDVDTSAGRFERLGGRASVFHGPPDTLYLPAGTRLEVTARSPLELAIASARVGAGGPAFAPLRIRPEQVALEARGGANVSRTIRHVAPPELAADRLLVVEVITPSGNWSSYPPHKHDRHAPPEEVDLEEIYYYRIRPADGFAIQRVYTADGRIDETLTVRDGELVLVPEGYHPVVAAPGSEVYYLNVLSGSGRSMAATDDPRYAWVRGAWDGVAR